MAFPFPDQLVSLSRWRLVFCSVKIVSLSFGFKLYGSNAPDKSLLLNF